MAAAIVWAHVRHPHEGGIPPGNEQQSSRPSCQKTSLGTGPFPLKAQQQAQLNFPLKVPLKAKQQARLKLPPKVPLQAQQQAQLNLPLKVPQKVPLKTEHPNPNPSANPSEMPSGNPSANPSAKPSSNHLVDQALTQVPIRQRCHQTSPPSPLTKWIASRRGCRSEWWPS